MKLVKEKVYLICWSDTFSVIRWRDIEDIEKEAKDAESYIKTVGIYIGKFGTKGEFEVFCSSKNTNPIMADYGMLTYIPKGTIKKIIKLL